MTAMLEHTNLTVRDAHATAKWMTDLFGWHIRWEGASMDNGYTIHIGTDDHYLAIYAPDANRQGENNTTHLNIGKLNHVGVVVDDIDAMEDAIRNAGFKPRNHADYEPGRRFYFLDHDGIEFEVVSYWSCHGLVPVSFEQCLL